MLKKIQTETMDSQWPKEGIFLKHPILVIPVTFLMVAGLKISRLWWILDIDMHIITKQRYVPLYSQNEQKIKSWLGLIFELNSNLQTNDLQNIGSQLLCPVFVYHVLSTQANFKRVWSILVFACHYLLNSCYLIKASYAKEDKALKLK